MDFSLTTLYVLPTGNLVADGFKRENLKPTQFGIFNSRYKAVTTADEAKKSPYIVFGQGRIENVPGLTHKYSDKISSGSLIEWYKTTGSPVQKNQITYAGFDGIDTTKNLVAGCDEEYSLTIRARSLYMNLVWANGLTRTVTVKTPCCEDCGDNCESIDPRWLANEFAKKINEEPRLSEFFVATPVFECTDAPDEPTTIPTVTYCATFCDNGDAGALGSVQAQFPDDVVVRSARSGSNSTYQLERLASEDAPASIFVTQPIALAVCDVCPSGYTLRNAGEQYIVERVLAVSDDINSAADKQTYANAVKAAYVVPKTFNAASGVDDSAETITLTSHGLVTGQSITYSTGGGTVIGGLTNNGTYFVIKVDDNTIKLANTKADADAGTAIDLTDGVGASHTVTVSSTATFLSAENGVAKVLITVDANQEELTAINSDIVTYLGEVDAMCIPPAGTSVAWTSCDTGFKVQRTLSITLTDDCDSDLASIQAAYPDATITLEESANCNSRYEMVQTSETTHTDCDFPVPPKFADVQPYRGIEWTVVADELTGSGCVAGVKIEPKALTEYAGNGCDPMNFPHEFDMITFEVFAYKGAATSQDFLTYDRCDNIPITTTQRPTLATGSGKEIFELEKRYHSYQTTMKHIYHNADFNGAFVRYSDPSKFYDVYYLKFKSPDLLTWDASTRQDESVIIAVPQGEGVLLEAFLLGYFGPEKFTAGVLSV